MLAFSMYGGRFDHFVCALFIDEKRKLSDGADDFFEYTRGKKIPPEGIPGFDFSDPESIVEFTRYLKGYRGDHVSICICRRTKMQKKKDSDGVERTIPCPHKVCGMHKVHIAYGSLWPLGL